MRSKRVRAIAVADLKSLWRERIVLFWTVIWPILWVLLVAYVFVPPQVGGARAFVVGVMNLDEGFEGFSGGETLISALTNVTEFKVRTYNSTRELYEDLEKARLDIGVVIPRDFSKGLVLGTADIYVYVSGDDPQEVQINRGFAQAFFYHFSREVARRKAEIYHKYFEAYAGNASAIYVPKVNATMSEMVSETLMGLANPLNVVLEEKVPNSLVDRPSIMGWYVIGAIGMTMLYSGFSFGATAVIVEKERGRLDRMIAARTTASDLFFGKTAAAGATLLAASLAIIAVGKAIGAKISWDPLNPWHWLVPLNLFLVFLMTMSMGFLISLASKTSRSASFLGITLGLLLSFITGIWVPKWMLSQELRALADVFPVTWAIDTIRGIVVFNVDSSELVNTQVGVVVATIVLVALGLLSYMKTISRYVEIA